MVLYWSLSFHLNKQYNTFTLSTCSLSGESTELLKLPKYILLCSLHLNLNLGN